MAERRTLRIPLFDGDEINMNLSVAAGWLSELAEQVPPEFEDTAIFLVEHERDDYSDGSGWVNIKAYYERPETDAEVRERELRAERERVAQRQYAEQRERQQYEALKAKFG